MKNRKEIGSYYTPKVVADFITNRIGQRIVGLKELKVLEPSAGDGVFVDSIVENEAFRAKISEFHVVEKEKKEADKIQTSSFIKISICDYLDFINKDDKKFDIVIGNPPYLKKSFLSKKQISACEKIHDEGSIFRSINNIWTAFLIKSSLLLDSNGILAFVLPTEFLQVKYANEVRSFLKRHFNRIEVFTFERLIFKDSKGQDTIILIAEKNSTRPGVFNFHIDNLDNISTAKIEMADNIRINESKWNQHLLESEELELIYKLKNQVKTVDTYCKSKAGITTAANDYFIVDIETADHYSLTQYLKPIIQRGAHVNGSIVFNKKHLENLIHNKKPSFLICFDENSKITRNQKINQYLSQGIKSGINLRYKMKQREVWYRVPNVGIPHDGFFLKRCHEYPKILKNNAHVLITDCGYNISMKENYKMENLIFSFYNSLTLALSELEGRPYGGGVLELTPNEFKHLGLPYVEKPDAKFSEYCKEFDKKTSIESILEKYDREILLKTIPSVTTDEVLKIGQIRKKLFQKRTSK